MGEVAVQPMPCFMLEESVVVLDATASTAVDTCSSENFGDLFEEVNAELTACSLPLALMDAKVRGERQADPQPTLERAEVASSGGGQPEIKHAATDKGEVKSDIAKPAMIRESEAHAPVGEVESIATEQFATGESEVKSEIAKLIVVHESEEGAHREVESIAMKQLTGECQALVHIVEAESQVAEQTTI